MIVRLLIALLIAFLIYTLVQSIKQFLKRPDIQPPEKTAKGEDMLQDPYCGTFVSRSDSFSCSIRGIQQFFCSEDCRDQYIAQVAKDKETRS
ncbi:MAG: hypothetical protein JRF07_06610 [Deltaproteobacteria bacterium]|jgi:YHS domain-containing protein|nr:hypothetical protein [Deltaproteobacteria bacterium]MBW2477873.1 hypothetical protein [Deltaproteobacteria bacterium]MBW2520221.1 hypothetical protein [Deltaproteobacteria bacterium]